MQSDGVVKSVNDFVINLIEPLVIVVAEGMLIGVQNGQSAEDAASSTVSGSIWAMLGGTVIAILAFAPIGLSPDNTGEYCRSLLQVVGISMMLSWLLAITATPVIGNLMLKPAAQSGDPCNNFLFRAYRAFLEGCLHRRLMTIAIVVIIFAFSLITLITSDDPLVLRQLADQARQIMEQDPIHNCVRLDWNDRVLVFRPQIRKDIMQSLGLTRPLINQAILTGTSGLPVGTFRDKNKSLSIIFGLLPEERNKIENLQSLPVWSPSAGRSVTLGSVISGLEMSYEDESQKNAMDGMSVL